MTLTTSAVDTSEAGRVEIWTLTQTDIPTGAQTVTLQGAIAASKYCTCNTFTAATSQTKVNASNKVDTTIAANPSVTVTTTAATNTYGGLHTGAASPAGSAGAGCTLQNNLDYGALASNTLRRTADAEASGSIVLSATVASDDYCIAAASFEEFQPPPSISSASMADADRSFAAPYQDISVTFSEAMHSTYSVGGTITGLTAQLNGGANQALTYRSGDDTTTWIVRLSLLVHNGDTVVIDYDQATGALFNTAGGQELVTTTDAPVTNNLTKRVRFVLDKAAGTAVASETVQYMVADYGTGAPSNASWMSRTDKGTTATDGSGNVDVQYTGSGAVGATVYIKVYRPHPIPVESLLWTETVD